MTQGIYEIRNKLNGKAYGGSSVNIRRRWKHHRWMLRHKEHHCTYLQAAWNLYGSDAFEFVVVEEIEDLDMRLAAEQKWLDEHHAQKTCYNIAITAGPLGPVSEETRRKVGAAHRGRKHTEKTKRRISAALKGKKKPPRTEEHRRNMSKAKMGKKLPPFTEEHKRNMSRAKKRWWAEKRAGACACP